MDGSRMAGILAALFAAFVWSLNFVIPFVIGDYTVFDFALLRFGISGLAGLGFLIIKIDAVRQLSPRDWLITAWLAFIGYVGYFLMVTGAAIYAGPVIAAALLGLVPIVLAVVGNIREGSVPWRSLSIPLMLVALGLLFVNWNNFAALAATNDDSLWVGMSLAVGAVALWTWFAVINQAALANRPGMDSKIWTALTLFGGGLEMLAFFPVGAAAGLFELPRLGASWDRASNLYLWGGSLAILASIGGVWAWNVAARKLPISLAAQLIVSETAFGAVFGLAAYGRWPTLAEACGIVTLIAGVVSAIHVFHRPPVAVDDVVGVRRTGRGDLGTHFLDGVRPVPKARNVPSPSSRPGRVHR
ncbi:MAG: DMT family transporter [Mesorhizobium sp.]|uniref:DMT family transporter n=2 Tax=Mesorhizobium sp. TaxID=1871066 RepID=UPI000FE67E8A|nr:MAG: DMT family transporter [Mesorhizobium sp.]RWE62842.1 MAG: DMT family transporter [Mesorhizobium sp.]RWF10439.1 MAG: DMT family transporter [Mesorhizobium sp.]RWF20664.1 MAG: DMT family transporter [Mesorhizobium sp.]